MANTATAMMINDWGNGDNSVNHRYNIDISDVTSALYNHYMDNNNSASSINDDNHDINDAYDVLYGYANDARGAHSANNNQEAYKNDLKYDLSVNYGHTYYANGDDRVSHHYSIVGYTYLTKTTQAAKQTTARMPMAPIAKNTSTTNTTTIISTSERHLPQY